MEHREEIRSAILGIIHDKSESGRLVGAQEIVTELKDRGLLESVDDEDTTAWEITLKHVLQENPDFREISGRQGDAYFYSTRALTETYAEILVWKSENPLWMIAEVVRKNSQRYPRPVPVVSFMGPPFDLTREEILACIEALGKPGEYQDIAQATTSAGTSFLYSSRYIDSEYAATLAEWIDVGQADNP